MTRSRVFGVAAATTFFMAFPLFAQSVGFSRLLGEWKDRVEPAREINAAPLFESMDTDSVRLSCARKAALIEDRARENAKKTFDARTRLIENKGPIRDIRRDILAKHRALAAALRQKPEIQELAAAIKAAENDPVKRAALESERRFTRLRILREDPAFREQREALLSDYDKLRVKLEMDPEVRDLLLQRQDIRRDARELLENYREKSAGR